MDKYCGFFGHRDFCCDESTICKIRLQIVNCIEKMGIFNFLVGFYGKFDFVCANVINKLKKQFPQIKLILVLSYLERKFNELDKDYIKNTFDEIIYPPIEKVPKKFAIVKCNEWIVSQCDYLIFYVDFSFGGACKMLEYAHKKKKAYINFGIKKL